MVRGSSRGVSEVSGNRPRSDRDTLIEQSITVIIQSSSVASYVGINKDFYVLDINIIVSEGQLFSAGSHLFFFGLHQKSSYALDQKPVTKNSGATYDGPDL